MSSEPNGSQNEKKREGQLMTHHLPKNDELERGLRYNEIDQIQHYETRLIPVNSECKLPWIL